MSHRESWLYLCFCDATKSLHDSTREGSLYGVLEWLLSLIIITKFLFSFWRWFNADTYNWWTIKTRPPRWGKNVINHDLNHYPHYISVFNVVQIDTTTLKSTHHDAKSLGLGYKYILAIVITIAVVAVILLLVFVAVRYKKCFQRSQSTYPRGNNVGDVPVRVQIYPNDDSEEKKHLNPHTSEQDESREKEWKDYATTEKGSPLAPENGTSQSHQTEINLSNQSS